ncbi:CxxxxCH/CxxCH domain-containing protein [Streptomyces sp. NPDC006259]|uniref:CxxxxCH/CxxCH domain-containing protein n=1 Tax=unclassified Streptomyces TaxID=2593676 RepID=UPI0033ADC8F3
MACSNRGIRVSCHSSLPNRNGALAASPVWTPAMACAAFQYAGNSSGSTWRWNWVLVHAASGVIVSA